MLKVYSATWCPHCKRTIDHLKKKGLRFEVLEIERQPQEIVQKVVEVNGGDDWVVPTLEFNGVWRPGMFFDPAELDRDLRTMGVTKNSS
jgi:mycoredoxin